VDLSELITVCSVNADAPLCLVKGRASRHDVRYVPIQVHMIFVVDNVADGQVDLHVLQFSPVSIIPLMLDTHSFIGHRRYIILPVDSVIKYA
jgi:hypothetical protein